MEEGKCVEGVTMTDDFLGDGEKVVKSVENILNMFHKLTSLPMEPVEGTKEGEKCGVGGGACSLEKDQEDDQLITLDNSTDGPAQVKGVGTEGVAAVTHDHHQMEVVVPENGVCPEKVGDKVLEASSAPILISTFQPLEKWSIGKVQMLTEMKSKNAVQGSMGKDSTPNKLFNAWDVMKPLTVQKPKECRSSGKDLAKVLKDLGPPLVNRKVASCIPSLSPSPLVEKLVGGVPADSIASKLDEKSTPYMRKKGIRRGAINPTHKTGMVDNVSEVESEDELACWTQPKDCSNSGKKEETMLDKLEAQLAKEMESSCSNWKHAALIPLWSGGNDVDKVVIVTPKEDVIVSPIVKTMSKRQAKKMARKAKLKGSSSGMDNVKESICSIPDSKVHIRGVGKKDEEVIAPGHESQMESNELDQPIKHVGPVTEKTKTVNIQPVASVKAKKMKGRRVANKRRVLRRSTRKIIPVLKGRNRLDEESEISEEDDSTMNMSQEKSEVVSNNPVTHEMVETIRSEEEGNASQACEDEKEEEEDAIRKLFPKIAMRGKWESLRSNKIPVVTYDDNRMVMRKGKPSRSSPKNIVPFVEVIDREVEEGYTPVTKGNIEKNTRIPLVPLSLSLLKEVDLKESHKEPLPMEVLNSETLEIVGIEEEGLNKMKESEARLESVDGEGITLRPRSPISDVPPLPMSPNISNVETTQVGYEMNIGGEIYHLHVEEGEMSLLFPGVSFALPHHPIMGLVDNVEAANVDSIHYQVYQHEMDCNNDEGKPLDEGKKNSKALPFCSLNFPLSHESLLSSSIPSTQVEDGEEILEDVVGDLGELQMNQGENSALSPSRISLLPVSSSQQPTVMEEYSEGLEQAVLSGGSGEKTLDLEENAPNFLIPSPSSSPLVSAPLTSLSSSPQQAANVEKNCDNSVNGEGRTRQADLEDKSDAEPVVSPPSKSSRTRVSRQAVHNLGNIDVVEDEDEDEEEDEEEDEDDEDDEFEERIIKGTKKGRKGGKKKTLKDPSRPRKKVKEFVYDMESWVKNARTPSALELVTPIELDVPTMTYLNEYRREDKEYVFTDGRSRWECPLCPKSYTTKKSCKKHIEKGNEHTLYGRCQRKGCTGFFNGPRSLLTHMEWHVEKDMACKVIYDEEKKIYRDRVDGDLDEDGLMDIHFARIRAYKAEKKLRKETAAEEKAKKVAELAKKKVRRGKTKDFLQMLEEEAGPSKRKKAKKSDKD